MKNIGTEFKVGLFTLVALVTTGYMFFVLSPDSFESTEKIIFYTVLDDAAGIIPKTHVKTNGVTVGKVKTVELQINQTRVELEVDAQVKVPVGSKIEIRSVGLLGDKFVEIIRVKDTGEYVENEGYLPINDDQVDMQQLISLVGSIAKDIKNVTNSLSGVLGGDRGERTVANIVADLQEITANTKSIVVDNREDIRSVMRNIEATTATLKAVLGDNRKDLNLIVRNIKSSTDDLREFAASAKELVTGDNRSRFDRIIASFDQTMSDVEKTAKNVALVSDKIEKGEGTIGRLINDDSVIAELQGAITDIRDVLRPATKMRVAVDYHNEFKKDFHAQHYFNVVFKTRPDKYYLLGFTDRKEAVTEERVRTNPSSDAAVEDRTTTTIVSNSLKFNAQFAKRWHFAQVRFGLFESTGGIAMDFYAFGDRLKLTSEAYDWNRDESFRKTAHVKAYLSVLFFNHIYALVGVDDPTEKDTENPDDDGKIHAKGLENVFVGAGLSFNDDDLKAIFGTAALVL